MSVVVRRYLERAGHAVHTTGSGAEALRLLGTGGVDLVVLDLGLPDVDGVEVLAAAHQRREAAGCAWTSLGTRHSSTAGRSSSPRPSGGC